MTMMSLWRCFRGNVVANSNWSCLLISVSEVHWRVQPTAAIDAAADSAKCMGLCAYCMSLNNASVGTVRKWLKTNNGTVTPNLNAIETSCLQSDAWSYFEIFIRSPKQFLSWKSHQRRYGTISRSNYSKSVASFRNRLTRVHEGDGKQYEHFPLGLLKSSRLGLCGV